MKTRVRKVKSNLVNVVKNVGVDSVSVKEKFKGPKIISHGVNCTNAPAPDYDIRFMCSNCLCSFDVNEEDIREENKVIALRGETYVYECPECGELVAVSHYMPAGNGGAIVCKSEVEDGVIENTFKIVKIEREK